MTSAAQSGDWDWEGKASERLIEGETVGVIDTIVLQVHYLTLDKLLEGIQKFINGWKINPSDYFGEDSNSMDAESAPAILQYALFGEVVYA
jgi:hypothetical protein